MPKNLPIPSMMIVMIITFVTVGATGACAFLSGESGTWRYKMTVAVDTPDGVKTGSAVREVRAKRGNIQLSPHGVPSVEVTGEAVVVDLGAAGQVFALLRGGPRGTDYKDAIVYLAFPTPNGEGALSAAGIRYYSSLKETAPVTLPEKFYPLIVRFRDPADPKTVEAVKPDDFAASFGPGVALKSVTIEMTREPVTTGVVERYLPSYQPIDEYMTWFKSLKYSDPRRLLPSDFGAAGQ